MEVKLGSVVTDSVTGFRGVVTAITHYLHGSSICRIESKNSVDRPWVDIGRLTEVSE